MDDLLILFNNIYNKPAPHGLQILIEDIDIDIDEYAAHIVGLVSSYLKGSIIQKSENIINEDLGNRLELGIEKLKELQNYKKSIDELAIAFINRTNQV